MIQIREITDKNLWESFHPASFIQSWNWSEFLESQGKKFYRLGIFENEKLVGIALGAFIKARRGAYLHFRHGPVIDWNNKEVVEATIDHIKNLAKKEGAWFIRISPLITPEEYSKSFLSKIKSQKTQMHDVDAQLTWVLDVDRSEEELLLNMRKNTRYSIRKAEKEGVTIEKFKDLSKMDEFWKIYRDTVERQKWTAYDLDYIKKEFEIFAKDDHALLFLAKYQGKYIATAIFTFYNGQSVYHHSGSLTEFQKIPASYLIQWEAIREAKARGFKKHNFWGVPLTKDNELDMHHPWTGLGLFKVGFGGHAERWNDPRDIPVSPKYYLTHFYEKFETKKRGLSKSSR